MMTRGKGMAEFEKEHGGGRVAALEHALEHATKSRKPLVVDVPGSDNTLAFAVIGDTHLGNMFEAEDELTAFCDRLRSDGIKTVLHCGDILDGHKVYPGQEFDMVSLGFAEQRKRFEKRAKLFDGMQVYFITGNHDSSFKKLSGANVGDSLMEVADNWKCIGEDYGEIVLSTANGRSYKIRLVHPDGGTAYAISYKGQRYAESIEGGAKPNMLCIGHFHKAEHMPSYRNIDVVQCGCFEGQTPFMARKGSAAHVGGWIIRVLVGDKASMSNSVRAEFVAYYHKG